MLDSQQSTKKTPAKQTSNGTLIGSVGGTPIGGSSGSIGGGVPPYLRPAAPLPSVNDLAGLNNPQNINPYGGVRTGGSGSSGKAVTPGIDQGTFNSILDMIKKSRPGAYAYEALDLPDYKAPAFYKFDPTVYNQAQKTINDQISAGRTSGNRTYADAATELNQFQNPFGMVMTQSPSVRDAMARMLQANGVNPDVAAPTARDAAAADQAFGNVQGLLAGAAEQRQASNLRANAGDQRRFNEMLDSEKRMLTSTVQMSMAQAKQKYTEDLFLYGKAEADKNYEIRMQEALANNQGRNQAAQDNMQSQNSFNQAMISPILDLILSGRNSAGVQGLDLSSLASLFG